MRRTASSAVWTPSMNRASSGRSAASGASVRNPVPACRCSHTMGTPPSVKGVWGDHRDLKPAARNDPSCLNLRKYSKIGGGKTTKC